MAKIKKSSLKRAEDGVSTDYKERQGNYPKETPKSQAGVGPSSNYAERQGQKSDTKTPLNKFPEAKVPETKQTFGQAFKSARSSGAKTFTFNGKSYTTQVKEEAAKPKPVVAKTAAVKVEAKPVAKVEPAKTVTTKVVSPVKKIEPVKAPEKKIEAVKKSPADSVRARMKVNSDTLRAKQTRYYTGKFGTMGGKTKK